VTEFVLVHGTTQSPAGWDRLAGELRRRGHGSTTIDMPVGTLRLFNPGPAVYQHRPAPLPTGISRAAIVPTAVRTLRPEWMRQATVQRLGIEPATIHAGHCPHVSQPEMVADILAQVGAE
jgi:hypothetical protein